MKRELNVPKPEERVGGLRRLPPIDVYYGPLDPSGMESLDNGFPNLNRCLRVSGFKGAWIVMASEALTSSSRLVR